MVTGGFLAEHFCEQHQGEGNSRGRGTEQISLTTARSHTTHSFFFFYQTPSGLWILHIQVLTTVHRSQKGSHAKKCFPLFEDGLRSPSHLCAQEAWTVVYLHAATL